MKFSRGFVFFTMIIIILIMAAFVGLGIYTIRLDNIVREKFEGKRWEIPAKVYARPLELFNGTHVSAAALRQELGLLNYKKADNYESPGTYVDKGSVVYVHTRGFDFGDSTEPEQVLEVTFGQDQVLDIRSTQQTGTGIARLEPILVGGIYPRHNEDRVLVQLSKVPQPLIDALIATEDRQFYQHHGVSPRGLARAMVSNATGGPRQGGSTLTQQLVKNFYLSPERTIKRKANEALMALLVELHYNKNDILEAYLNEVNLGQNGNHSINGFGLASQFYFGQPLNELKLPQLAFLVGLVKGPSLYNPWRNPELAKERRNVVLHNMLVTGKIDQDQYEKAITAKLGILTKPTAGRSQFPDFLDVVRRQLKEEYQEDDLTGEGLRIFTTLDPIVQTSANTAFDSTLSQLIKRNPKRLEGLQGAVTVANPENGELLAVVGGSGTFTGFNRALDAKRQVGSLLKPVVYLNALQSQRYNLISPISDEQITINGMGMKDWTPKNYDGRSHGIVPLSYALAHSYNLATVRLGWEMGMPSFINTLHSLGIEDDIKPYPAILLGAINLSPMQVLGMYQVYAANGFRYAPRSIRSVVDAKGVPLQRYSLNVRQSLDPGAVYLLNYALQQVMRSGTGASAYRTLPSSLNLAGKSGTTNDARDSWFAGYSGNYVAVVWLGHDDNRPIGLTGSSGALPIWVNIMKQLNLTSIEPIQPTNVQWQWIDQGSGQLSAQGCPGAIYIPMLAGTVPGEATECGMLAMYNSEQAAHAGSELDEFGEPVYQQYARRLPESPSKPEASITLELPPEKETGRPPVVKRFWSSEN
ncbi:penicillin-binding protein 1B [Alkanindiges sp. WGS2144]|uniref:penicillin-binding protein 1B n=1 Tax=Alkanindiges sp. WGS2144 TaxID=3366808 RepID=UPI00375228E0